MLQRFLNTPEEFVNDQRANEVIASQIICPGHMALEEYCELGSMSVGGPIRWANLISQLAMPGVDFRKLDTLLIVQQCIYQTGPVSETHSPLRRTHCLLEQLSVALSVIHGLTAALQRHRENWESVHALNAFVVIATRVISLNVEAREAGFAFLRDARHVAIEWVKLLREKAYISDNAEDRMEFVSKSVEIALVCALTFEVDYQDVEEALHSPNDAAVLFWSSIVVQEGGHILKTADPHVQRLNLRLQRLLDRSSCRLLSLQSGIDTAINLIWSSYEPRDLVWTPISPHANHWMEVTYPSSYEQAGSMQLHFNILTGQLLVNGIPLEQAPVDYRSHPLFKLLFTESLVEVMPATKPGFKFSTKRPFYGYQVELVMRHDNLIVCATHHRSVYHIISSDALRGSLPKHFVDDYVLWYNLETKQVQLRPSDEPWNSKSTKIWTLSRSQGSLTWRLQRGQSSLLGVESKAAQLIARIFRPLADPCQIHSILERNEKVLRIEIPDLHLEFSIVTGCR
ncbi:hypothetical protein MRB53_040482 [Persea americana]|nr:hypothetical protein MRB53_040482 [Persea americana]